MPLPQFRRDRRSRLKAVFGVSLLSVSEAGSRRTASDAGAAELEIETVVETVVKHRGQQER